MNRREFLRKAGLTSAGFALAPIAALSICLSLYLTPSAAVLVSVLLTLGASTFARASTLVGGDAGPIAAAALRAFDWLMPRMDLFDLGKKAAFDWGPVPAWVIGDLAVYALLYTLLPLAAAVLRFRRMAL